MNSPHRGIDNRRKSTELTAPPSRRHSSTQRPPPPPAPSVAAKRYYDLVFIRMPEHAVHQPRGGGVISFPKFSGRGNNKRETGYSYRPRCLPIYLTSIKICNTRAPPPTRSKHNSPANHRLLAERLIPSLSVPPRRRRRSTNGCQSKFSPLALQKKGGGGGVEGRETMNK